MAIKTKKVTNTDSKRKFGNQAITRKDLNEFRTLLLADLSEICSPNPQQPKPWLNTTELRQIINLSPQTLKTLRTTNSKKIRANPFNPSHPCAILSK